MDSEDSDVPAGVSVWRGTDGRIVAAAYVWAEGFEWCQIASKGSAPSSREELAARRGREYFPLFDDEKTQIVGPLEIARAFVRAVVSADLRELATLTSASWPGEAHDVDVWPPIDLSRRAELEPETPWNAPELFPANESPRIAKYRKLQSKYRQEVLHAKPGRSGNYAALGNYLDVEEVAANPQLNFLNSVALAHAMEREVIVRREGGALNPVRLRHNMLSSMPLCFNLFGTMRAEPDFLMVFQDLFDNEATRIREIVCEWAPQPPSNYLEDGTAFDAIVFYDTPAGSRFCGIEAKYTEPFSQEEYISERYDQVTETSGWFPNRDAASRLAGRSSNQLWRNLMLAASLEMEGQFGTGRVAVVALADDPGAKKAIEIIGPELSAPGHLLWVPLESIVDRASQLRSLSTWAQEFGQRYLG